MDGAEAGMVEQLDSSECYPIYETEMLTNVYTGCVTRTTYYSDGTSESIIVPKYPPIILKIWIY